jgi:uncharacterized membrane protein YdbT with pleckstrin-like domain
MAKKRSKALEGATDKDKEHFQRYLAEDEELVVASGYGKIYTRHQAVIYVLIPGGIFILAGLAYSYFTKTNIGIGLLVGLVLAIIFAILKAMWLYHSHRYLLTTRRVIIKNGILSVKLTTALYDKITHIEVDQSFYDRLVMKHGNIIINTAGGNSDEIKLSYIDDPIDFKNVLERLINREREGVVRRRERVETIEGEIVEE